MPEPSEPHYTVEQLLPTGYVTEATRRVLEERSRIKDRGAEHIFSDDLFAVLEAVGDCLFPQDNRTEKIPLAVLFELSMLKDKGQGWRYDALPPLKEAITAGLQSMDKEAIVVYGQPFTRLQRARQEQIIQSVQQGKTASDAWVTTPPTLFFEELLAHLTEIYYSHPLAKNEIGEIAFADAQGWDQIGLNAPHHLSIPTPPHGNQ